MGHWPSLRTEGVNDFTARAADLANAVKKPEDQRRPLNAASTAIDLHVDFTVGNARTQRPGFECLGH